MRHEALESVTDWKAFDALTDEAIMQAAQSDPDAQPLTAAQLQRLQRLPEAPGGDFFDRLRALPREKQ